MVARRALILANERFDDPEIPSLASPLADSARLKTLLEREDVGAYEVKLCANADTKTAQRTIHDFFDSAGPDDLSVLMLSGHGLKDRWSRLYFATADTEREHLAATALHASFIRQVLEDSRAAQKVLIIDACYGGAYIENMIPKKAGDLEISKSDFGSSDARGTAIITAATAVQLAGEREHGGTVQSVFTRCMIEGIESGDADSSHDGKITLTELFDYVRERMRSEAPGQTPNVFNRDDGAGVVLARNPRHVAMELPGSVIKKAHSKLKERRAGAVGDLERLVAAGGGQAPLALAELRQLAQDENEVVRGFAERSLARVGGSVARPTSSPPLAPAKSPAPVMALLGEPSQSGGSERNQGDRDGKSRQWFSRPVGLALIGGVALLAAVGGGWNYFAPVAEAEVYTPEWIKGDWASADNLAECKNRMHFEPVPDEMLKVEIRETGVLLSSELYDIGKGRATADVVVTEDFTYKRAHDQIAVTDDKGRPQFMLSRCTPN